MGGYLPHPANLVYATCVLSAPAGLSTPAQELMKRAGIYTDPHYRSSEDYNDHNNEQDANLVEQDAEDASMQPIDDWYRNATNSYRSLMSPRSGHHVDSHMTPLGSASINDTFLCPRLAPHPIVTLLPHVTSHTTCPSRVRLADLSLRYTSPESLLGVVSNMISRQPDISHDRYIRFNKRCLAKESRERFMRTLVDSSLVEDTVETDPGKYSVHPSLLPKLDTVLPRGVYDSCGYPSVGFDEVDDVVAKYEHMRPLNSKCSLLAPLDNDNVAVSADDDDEDNININMKSSVPGEPSKTKETRENVFSVTESLYPSDMWAVGLFMWELYEEHHILPHITNELNVGSDVLLRIFQIFGTPTEYTWKGVKKLPRFSVNWPQIKECGDQNDELNLRLTQPDHWREMNLKREQDDSTGSGLVRLMVPPQQPRPNTYDCIEDRLDIGHNTPDAKTSDDDNAAISTSVCGLLSDPVAADLAMKLIRLTPTSRLSSANVMDHAYLRPVFDFIRYCDMIMRHDQYIQEELQDEIEAEKLVSEIAEKKRFDEYKSNLKMVADCVDVVDAISMNDIVSVEDDDGDDDDDDDDGHRKHKRRRFNHDCKLKQKHNMIPLADIKSLLCSSPLSPPISSAHHYYSPLSPRRFFMQSFTALRTQTTLSPLPFGFYVYTSEITANMRLRLVDWIYDVVQEFSFHPSVSYLAVALIDRSILMFPQCTSAKIQRLGHTCLLMALKVTYPSSSLTSLLTTLCLDESDPQDTITTARELEAMETLLLSRLSLPLSQPTIGDYLNVTLTACWATPFVDNLARYLTLLAQYLPTVSAYPPMTVAMACTLLATRGEPLPVEEKFPSSLTCIISYLDPDKYDQWRAQLHLVMSLIHAIWTQTPLPQQPSINEFPVFDADGIALPALRMGAVRIPKAICDLYCQVFNAYVHPFQLLCDLSHGFQIAINNICETNAKGKTPLFGGSNLSLVSLVSDETETIDAVKVKSDCLDRVWLANHSAFKSLPFGHAEFYFNKYHQFFTPAASYDGRDGIWVALPHHSDRDEFFEESLWFCKHRLDNSSTETRRVASIPASRIATSRKNVDNAFVNAFVSGHHDRLHYITRNRDNAFDLATITDGYSPDETLLLKSGLINSDSQRLKDGGLDGFTVEEWQQIDRGDFSCLSQHKPTYSGPTPSPFHQDIFSCLTDAESYRLSPRSYHRHTHNKEVFVALEDVSGGFITLLPINKRVGKLLLMQAARQKLSDAGIRSEALRTVQWRLCVGKWRRPMWPCGSQFIRREDVLNAIGFLYHQRAVSDALDIAQRNVVNAQLAHPLAYPHEATETAIGKHPLLRQSNVALFSVLSGFASMGYGDHDFLLVPRVFTTPSATWASIPDSVVLCIFSYLTTLELCNMKLVNKRLYALASHFSLWRPYFNLSYCANRVTDHMLLYMAPKLHRCTHISLANARFSRQILNLLLAVTQESLEHLDLDSAAIHNAVDKPRRDVVRTLEQPLSHNMTIFNRISIPEETTHTSVQQCDLFSAVADVLVNNVVMTPLTASVLSKSCTCNYVKEEYVHNGFQSVDDIEYAAHTLLSLLAKTFEQHRLLQQAIVKSQSHVEIELITDVDQASERLEHMSTSPLTKVAVALSSSITDFISVLSGPLFPTPQLTHLSLHFNTISPADVLALVKQSPMLSHLTLNRTKASAADLIQVFSVESIHRLRILSIEECVYADDSVLDVIANNIPLLQAFRCDSNARITNAGVIKIAQSCPELRLFGISYLLVTDVALKAIGEGCKHLEHIDIDFLQVTWEGIAHVMKGCRRLRHLSCFNLPFFDEECLKYICKYGANIETLIIAHCHLGQPFSLGILETVVASCPVLSILDVRGLDVVQMAEIPQHIWKRIHIVGDF